MIETKRRLIALISITSAIAMIFLDSTILPIALPTIQKDLNIPQGVLQWIINAYTLGMATFVITGGKLGDRFGHRKIFCLGMCLFAFSSLIGGFAPSMMFLIYSRTLQGIGAAFMSPSAMALILETFPPSQRGRAIGLSVSIGSLFLSIGPFIGGFFTQVWSWRLAFFVNVPIAIAGIFSMMYSIPKSKITKKPFDIPGFLALFSGLFCFILLLMQAREWGIMSPIIILLFFLTCVFFALLYYTSKGKDHPFIDFSLYRDKIYFGGSVLIFCTQFFLMMTVFWALYFQRVLSYSPVEAGLLTLISTLPIMFFATFSGYLMDRVGPKIPVSLGFFMLSISFIWFMFFNHSVHVFYLLPALFLFGTGISFIMTALSTATLSSASPNARGIATGMYNTIRFSGATVGVAVISGAISQAKFFRFRELIKSNSLTKNIYSSQFKEILSEYPVDQNMLSAYSHEQGLVIKQSLISSSVFGFAFANFVCLVLAIFCLFFSIYYLRFFSPKKLANELENNI